MLWIGLLAGIISAAPSGPTYLACEWHTEKETGRADVSLDEANQRATIAINEGRTATRPAVYTPTQVTVIDAPMTWTFSRIDLTFRRTFSFMPPSDSGNVGTCKIAPTPPKRAF